MADAEEVQTRKYDPVRSVRVSEEIWEKARRRAALERVSMSHIMLTFVEGYADGLINLPTVTVTYEQMRGAS